MKWIMLHKAPINQSALFWAVFIAITFFGCNTTSKVIPYPAPPGLITSPDFTVQVNGADVWVERVGGSKMEQVNQGAIIYRGILEDMNVTNFTCSGPVDIKITASENIKTFLIRPKSRNIKAEVKGRELHFKIPAPQKLIYRN